MRIATTRAALIVVAGLTATAWPDTIYVDVDNCPGPGRGTPGDPYCSIQVAIDASVDGDEIEVAAGTYDETIDFLGRAVRLYSAAGAGVTVIDGNGTSHVVQCVSDEDADTVLEGFTITGGNTPPFSDLGGGGMLIEGSDPTVIDCVFMGNTALEGGALAIINSHATITGCTFTGNSASRGGAVYALYGEPVFTECTFVNNVAGAIGGAIYSEYFGGELVNVRRCTFIGNSAETGGGGIWAHGVAFSVVNSVFRQNTNASDSFGSAIHVGSGDLVVVNCTLAFNTGGNAVLGKTWPYANVYGYNSIVWFNEPPTGMTPLPPSPPGVIYGTTSSFEYCNVESGGIYSSPAHHNISAEPSFVDVDGSDDVMGNEDDDLRLAQCAPSIDAGTPALPSIFYTPVDLDGNPRYVDDAGVPNIDGSIDIGAYERQIDSAAAPIFVPGDFSTIQAAIDAACRGEEVIVAPGTYFEAIDLHGRQITVRSSDGPEVTIINGGGADHVVQCNSREGPETVIEGFTITGGIADGAEHAADGAGMYIDDRSEPTVRNCVFQGNVAFGRGGGMYCGFASGSLVQDCTFDGNMAVDGGALYNDWAAIPELIGCAFIGNSATSRGGAVVNIGDAVFTDCLFEENGAEIGGGMVNDAMSEFTAADVTLTGCLFIGNTASQRGGAMVNMANEPTIEGCVFTANQTNGAGAAMFNGAESLPLVINCAFNANAGVGAGVGAGMYNNDGSHATVIHCTFEANTADGLGGGAAMVNNVGSSPAITGCIFAANTPQQIVNYVDSEPVIAFSNVIGSGGSGEGWDSSLGTDAGDNIDADPQFADPDGPDDFPGNQDDDLRLGRFSPCADAADAVAIPAGITTDADGNPRFVDDAAIADTGMGSPPPDMGAYERQEASLPLTVPPGGSIQAALDTAYPIDRISVPPGTYVEAIDLLGKRVELRSIGGPRVTTIDGNGADHVVSIVSGEGPATVIDGFTITGGVADGGGTNDNGGGMIVLASSPTVMNCIFRGSAASLTGGGMYNAMGAGPSVLGCIFSGNAAEFGGGAFNDDTAEPSFVNCTFNANAASVGAGMFNGGDSSSTIANTIFWPDDLFSLASATPTVTYSDVPGGHDGDGNINLPPRYFDADGVDDTPGTADDDLSLGVCSEAIDAGSNAAVPTVLSVDLDGNPRYFDDQGQGDTGSGAPPLVDMGALERPIISPTTPHVPADFLTIQDAIDFACTASEIIVDPGTYDEVIDFKGKAVHLVASGGPDVTVIDGGGALHVLLAENVAAPGVIIDGFTITGGMAVGTTPDSDGGGLYADNSRVTLIGCIVRGNAAQNRGAGLYAQNGSDVTLINAIFNGNLADFGGGAYLRDSTSTITNCTFTFNDAASDSGSALYTFNGDTAVANSIFRLNGNGPVWVLGGTASYSYCVLPVGVSGTGNVDVDPRFADADGPDNLPGNADDDLRLEECSPVIDAGTNGAYFGGVTTDADGNPRFYDDAGTDDTGAGTPPVVDLGAYERQTESPNPVHVPGDFATIQAAIDFACENGDVIVSPGTYVEAIDFNGKAVHVRSTDGPAVTIIDAGGALHAVQAINAEGPGSILDGFTVTGGIAVGSTPDSDGAGMYMSGASPTVLNCIFRDNHANNRGGGLVATNGSMPTVTQCVFTGNTAMFGGGLYFGTGADAVVTSCSIAGNDATAGAGGGVYTFDADPVVTNCVIFDNGSGEVWNLGGSPVYSYCVVPAVVGGAGNLDVDPRFVDADGADDVPGTADDDLRLDDCSPAADAGTNTALPASVTTDLDGDPRFADDAGIDDVGEGTPPLVDIGAYERQGDSPNPVYVPGDFASIQAALDFACDNGEVIVDPGVYVGPIDFNGRAVTLRSSGGAAVTTIDGGGGLHVVQAVSGEGPETILDGFTITGGAATGSTPDSDGGGMYIGGADPTVRNCIFRGNTATNRGAGLYAADDSGATITNCLFYANTAAFGGAVYLRDSSLVELADCTVTGNEATSSSGGGVYTFNSDATITNTIVRGNVPNDVWNFGGSPSYTYCVVPAIVGGEGNIDVDPLFLYPDGSDGVPGTADDDYRLRRFSPCVDAGSNAAVPGDADPDLAGAPRFYDDAGVAPNGGPAVVDIGAYERPVDSVAGLVLVPSDAPTIQAGIEIAVDGDEVRVGPGTYQESVGFFGKAVTLRSTDGPAATIIDGNGATHVVRCLSGEGPDTVLDGFTITGGNAGGAFPNDRGGGLVNWCASPTVINCIFANNHASAFGGGIFSCNNSGSVSNCVFEGNTSGNLGGAMYSDTGSTLTVSDCTFTGNSAVNDGGGMYNGSSSHLTIDDCTFEDNDALRGGGVANSGSDPAIQRSRFTGNTAQAGGAILNVNGSDPAVVQCILNGNESTSGGAMFNEGSSSPTVTQCTITGNDGGFLGGGLLNANGADPTVANCIVWGNAPDQINNDGATATVTYCLVQGGFAGDGNVSGDPMFVDADGADNVPGTADDDLHTLPCSPTIDAGDNGALPGGVITDLDGNPRFVDDAGISDTGLGSPPVVDIGVYERQTGSFPGGMITVPRDFASIQAAIDAACDRGIIEVAPGTYVGLIDFGGKRVTVRSADGPEVTILDGGGVSRVVQFVSGESSGTVLEGFTITGGWAPAGPGGGVYIDGGSPTVIDCMITGNVANIGGGLYASGGPTVVACTFEGNSASNGGGLFSGDALTATDCVFVGNSAYQDGGGARLSGDAMFTGCTFEANDAADEGGGIYAVGTSMILADCTFIANVAGDRGAAIFKVSGGDLTATACRFAGNQATNRGGGLYIINDSGPVTMTQCTFSGNAAGELGGAMRIGGNVSATVTGSTFSGNSAPEAGVIRVESTSDVSLFNCILWGNGQDALGGPSSPTVEYSVVEGGFEGTGNIDIDPRLVDADGPDGTIGTIDDDLRLRPCSPAADAGSNLAVPSQVTTDIDGNPRFVDDEGVVDTGLGDPVVDIGAYERQFDSFPGGVTSVPDDYTTIQEAIDAACESGSQVIVGPGTYVGTVDFRGQAITVRSSSGPEATILDGDGAAHVVVFNSGEDGSAVLDGFTITGGNADGPAPDDGGGGILVSGSSPTIVNCVIEGNGAAGAGGGLHNDGGSPLIVGCIFRGNNAGTESGGSGGAMSHENGAFAVVINSIFAGNSAVGFGGAISCDASSSPLLQNCSLTGNGAGVSGGAIHTQSAAMTVSNSILWNNSPDEIDDSGSTASVTFCDVQGGYAGIGNIDVDPAFVDADGPDDMFGTPDDDLRLMNCSPVTDAGENNDLILAVAFDLDGNLRLADDAGIADSGVGDPPLVDLGAYERQDDSFAGGVVLVPSEQPTIQAAIDAACARGEIIVAPGTYVGTIDFKGKNLTVRSSDGPAVTILDGVGLGPVVAFVSGEGAETVLEGFTVTGGNARDGGGIQVGDSSPTVAGCVLTGNTATFAGGAIAVLGATSSPTIVNCRFDGNMTAGQGGTVALLEGSANIINGTFTGNTASAGGAVYNGPDSSATVSNCILWGNTPNEVIDFGESLVVTYSDVQGGYPGTGNVEVDPMFLDADGRLAPCSPVVDAGNNDAVPPDVTGDLDGGARFVDDAGVIDTGAGSPPLVDMGAFERQYSSFDGGTVTVPAQYPTIQAAIDSACGGGEIVVAPGVYVEAIDFKGKPLTLRGAGGPYVTTIDGDGAFHVVHVRSGEGPDTVLDGFTITGGVADASGADDDGAGIRVVNSDPTIRNCIIRGNDANVRGGGLYLNGSTGTVVNCIFSDNIGAFQGGAIWANGSPTIVNCTFYANFSNNGGAMVAQVGSSPVVTNCVFRDNTVNTIEDLSGGLSVTYSNVEGGWPGTGNIDADPMFVDADGPDDVPGTGDDDLRLLPGSPSIETGDNGAVPRDITTDLDGNDRFFDADGDRVAVVDMGPYETVTDVVACPWDLDDDGTTAVTDLVTLILAWGGDPGGPPDFNGDGIVGVTDLVELVLNWGPCP